MRSWAGRPGHPLSSITQPLSSLSVGGWEGAGQSVQVTPKSSFPSFLFQSLQPVTGKMDPLLLLELLPGNWACCCAKLIRRSG